MSEKRFIIKNSNAVSTNYPSERIYDNYQKRDLYNSEIVIMLNKLWEENEQLRKQLLICQQSKNDNGGFQVWEVPPIQKGMRIKISTGEKDE